MDEETRISKLREVVSLVDENSTKLDSYPEAKNLESILWYLKELKGRVVDNQFANLNEFSKATQVAEDALFELIWALNSQKI